MDFCRVQWCDLLHCGNVILPRPKLLLKHSYMRVEAVIFGRGQYDVTRVQKIAPVHEISSPYSFCYLIIRNIHWLV